MDHQFGTDGMITQHNKQPAIQSSSSSSSSEAPLQGLRWKQNSAVIVEETRNASCSTAGCDPDETANAVTRLPPNVDPEVFKLLPEDIQKELLSPAYVSSLYSTSSSQSGTDVPSTSKSKLPETLTDSESISDTKDAANKLNSSNRVTTVNHQGKAGTSAFPEEEVMEEGGLSFPRLSDCEFPGNVDPKVFSELPPDVQRELMSEWKQQKPILKTSSSKKPGKSLMSKDRKAPGKGSQANNLFKYFKPS